MNIHEFYLSGLSSARTRFIMNPMRRILFKLMRPYFNYFIAEFGKLSVQPSLEHRFNTLEIKIHTTSKILEDMGHRFNTLDTRMHANSKDLEEMRHRFNTLDTRMHANSKDLEAMRHRFNTLETRMHAIGKD